VQFHSHLTMRPANYRGRSGDFLQEFLLSQDDGSKQSAAATFRAGLECGWIQRSRPFYNVYPIAIELCAKTSLKMKWGDICFPTRYLLLRFPAGHEPLGIRSALMRVPTETKEETKLHCHASRMKLAAAMSCVQLCGFVAAPPASYLWSCHSPGRDLRDEPVEKCLDLRMANGVEKSVIRSDEEDAAGNLRVHEAFLVKLLAFIGLLARGTDLITPAILAADREEYDATSDESRKRWLEQRAARRQGRGFDIGRSLEIERASSPHWRSPHLALFHTGPGRTIPALKLRSGCVVIPKDMSQVPTGYLGPEREGEEHKELPAVFRTNIPSRMRFHVFRRDGHRCRLCGMTADDGVTLECDHIIAVANGGKTEIPNLWTLCRPCNNGKSDSDLHLALEENRAMEKARKEVKRGVRV
jgi:hypothetical protein